MKQAIYFAVSKYLSKPQKEVVAFGLTVVVITQATLIY
jgi:hypothetical protein